MPKLLVINYAMNERDAVFPHQIEVVRRLVSSHHFQSVSVITNSTSSTMDLPEEIKVYNTKWKQNRKIRNSITFLYFFFRLLKSERSFYIFSHMTEVQSALISPFTKCLGLKHILWYAHKSRSPYLVWNSIWVDKVLTSTRESCPIKSNKVVPIGQAIDEKLFLFGEYRDFSASNLWIHVGRIDPSKGIHDIIALFSEYKKLNQHAQLVLIGKPTVGNEGYFEEVRRLASEVSKEDIKFLGALDRTEIAIYLRRSDLFIHAYQGSLDKTLVEATMVGIPVITCNYEFLKEFKSFGSQDFQIKDDEYLRFSLATYLQTPSHLRESISRHNRDIAIKGHSLDAWTSRLIQEIGL